MSKERLDQLSETRAHQGVIAQVAAYEYSTVEEILEKAEEKGEPPFLVPQRAGCELDPERGIRIR